MANSGENIAYGMSPKCHSKARKNYNVTPSEPKKIKYQNLQSPTKGENDLFLYFFLLFIPILHY